MTIERPLALALLAALPLVWWMHRSRRDAAAVRVASLLAFRGAAAAVPSAAPRRALDPVIVLVLTAISLLALAASGPTLGSRRAAAFYVVTDGSISMSARTCDAVNRANELLERAMPGAERVDHPLVESAPADGLPGSLAPHLEAATAAGFPGIVLVTDAAFAAIPGVAVIGPSSAPRLNLAIASVALDGDDAVIALRNYGAEDAEAKLRCGETVRDVAVAGGATGVARFPAPPAGEREFATEWKPRRSGPVVCRIESPADDLAADDESVVVRVGGALSVALNGAASPRLAAAVRACGSAIGRPGPWDAEISYGTAITAPDSRRPQLLVAPGTKRTLADKPADIRRVAIDSPHPIHGAEVVGRGGFADVLPAPGTTLAAACRLVGGDAAWSDSNGTLVAVSKDLVVVAVDPEEPASDWHRDPSFPSLIAAALDHLAGGPDRLERLDPVPASESDVVHAAPVTSGPEEIRAVARPAAPSPSTIDPARWLAVLAAALLAAAAYASRR